MNQSKWKKITGQIPRKVLVTNNLKAMDAVGNMSHVWLSEYVHESKEPEAESKNGRFYDLNGPSWLTHYCEIPQFHPPHVRREQAKKQKQLREKESQ